MGNAVDGDREITRWMLQNKQQNIKPEDMEELENELIRKLSWKSEKADPEYGGKATLNT